MLYPCYILRISCLPRYTTLYLVRHRQQGRERLQRKLARKHLCERFLQRRDVPEQPTQMQQHGFANSTQVKLPAKNYITCSSLHVRRTVAGSMLFRDITPHPEHNNRAVHVST